VRSRGFLPGFKQTRSIIVPMIGTHVSLMYDAAVVRNLQRPTERSKAAYEHGRRGQHHDHVAEQTT